MTDEVTGQIKPITVELMGLASQPPTSFSHHVPLLRTLAEQVSTVPRTAMTPSMINYILFPVTQLLRRNDPTNLPDTFLEAIFGLLAIVVRAWKDVDAGIDPVAWEQLWKFTTASVGQALSGDTAGKDKKGKRKELSQETQIQAVELLSALLSTNERSTHPTRAMLDMVDDQKSPLLPTLFQTVTILLETIKPSPPNSHLQTTSLRLLRVIVQLYFRKKQRFLASILPGVISSIAKLVHSEGKSIKGEVAQLAAGLAAETIISTLRDEDLRSMGVLGPRIYDLDQLPEECSKSDSLPPPTDPPTPDPGRPPDPFPPLTASYLAFTSTQLLTALSPMLHDLASHQSDLARFGAVVLAFSLMAQCGESLSNIVLTALSTLLILSKDSFDQVSSRAQQSIKDLYSQPNLQLDNAMNDLLSESVRSIPRLILSRSDNKVSRLTTLAIAIAEITEQTKGQSNPIAHLLGPSGKVERWSWALLDCLEVGRPSDWRASHSTAARAAALGWEQKLLTSSNTEGMDVEQDGLRSFSHFPLRHVESEDVSRQVAKMLVAFGSAGGDGALFSVEYFLNFATSTARGQVARAASGMWVAQQLLDGISQGQEQGADGRASKATRKMARQLARVVVELDQLDDEEQPEDGQDPAQDGSEEQASEALVPVEQMKGLDTLTTLLDRPTGKNPFAAQETRRLERMAQQTVLNMLGMSALALSSQILGSSFRPLLLTTLYTILADLASPQPLIADCADIALSHVAYNTGYAGVRNLILDNTDYIINVVSQRLGPSRLSPTAPLVLIAMIRLVGSDIVPMVHDIVDEIFDALDDYHGYETLTSALLAVLVTLIDVMAKEVVTAGPSEARLKKMAELNRVGAIPDPKKDIERFSQWYQDRKANRDGEVSEILSRAPQRAWGKEDAHGPNDDPNAEEEGDQDAPMNDDAEVPPTRAEEVCKQILEKSLNFLSHRSPFLRSRVLSLIAHATPVLASGNREGDLLPLIDNHWGTIMKRLDDLPYVTTEAAEVVASLCEHCGDFMSRRIMDHAWPRFKRIMEAQRQADQHSALARRGAVGTTSQWTVSHRLYVAIISTAQFVVTQVPVDDGVIWDMMTLFLPMLDARAHEDLREKAMELYQALGRRDGDALWTVLQAVSGGQEGVWSYLSEPGLDVATSVKHLLESIDCNA